MPLFMDIHVVDSDDFSVEDVVKAHMEDLAVQDEFGVVQLKYWVNVEAKTIFCLMKGPDKEACNQVHVQSHGNTACNIIEVADNEYNLFMGMGTDVNDLAQTQSGEVDTGYRTLLLTNIVCFKDGRNSFVKELHKVIKKHNGVLILEPENELLISFVHATEALLCANDLAKQLKEIEHVEFNMAVVCGKPVDEVGDEFFEEVKARVRSLTSLGLSNKIYLDQEVQVLSDKELLAQQFKPSGFSIVRKEGFELALQLSKALLKNLSSSEFNSEKLYASLGLSKSQAYRQIKRLTDQSPNQVIQECRLQKAVNGITHSQKNISEIAYESGFNSPTYFTRTFKKRFGLLPTEVSRV